MRPSPSASCSARKRFAITCPPSLASSRSLVAARRLSVHAKLALATEAPMQDDSNHDASGEPLIRVSEATREQDQPHSVRRGNQSEYPPPALHWTCSVCSSD